MSQGGELDLHSGCGAFDSRPVHVTLQFFELLEAGRKLPAITVRQISPSEYRLVDGRHRLEAQRRLGHVRVRACITL